MRRRLVLLRHAKSARPDGVADHERDDDRLAWFLAHLPPWLRVAVELRHPTWQHDDVFDLLARHEPVTGRAQRADAGLGADHDLARTAGGLPEVATAVDVERRRLREVGGCARGDREQEQREQGKSKSGHVAAQLR